MLPDKLCSLFVLAGCVADVTRLSVHSADSRQLGVAAVGGGRQMALEPREAAAVG